jgi:hypothetical protein
MQKDPNPQGMYSDGANPYQFVTSDPVAFTDPTGLTAYNSPAFATWDNSGNPVYRVHHYDDTWFSGRVFKYSTDTPRMGPQPQSCDKTNTYWDAVDSAYSAGANWAGQSQQAALNNATSTRNDLLLGAGAATLGGVVRVVGATRGMGGRVLTTAEQAEFEAFATRAQKVGLKPSPYRTGSYGTIDACGKYREVARVDVAEAGASGFRGKTHIHITDVGDHLPVTTKLPGE